LGLFYLFYTWAKGKAPPDVCPETVVSPQLSAQAPAAVCIVLENTVIEDLSIIKVDFEELYVCLCYFFYMNLLYFLFIECT